ncbi:hypothetical protein HZ326_25581 [Fusarium oxysporum f. sp. albedinis]|nr:hypothetical protein HZ326_25581 [Fusarium oxysporum f. sp. albedinis]
MLFTSQSRDICRHAPSPQVALTVAAALYCMEPRFMLYLPVFFDPATSNRQHRSPVLDEPVLTPIQCILQVTSGNLKPYLIIQYTYYITSTHITATYCLSNSMGHVFSRRDSNQQRLFPECSGDNWQF